MFIDPKAIVNQLSFTGVATIADLGTGSGAWAIACAEKLGASVSVYGVDVQEDMVTRLRNSARELKLPGITPLHANIEKLKGVPLRDGSVDLVIIANVLYCAESREGVLNEASRLVKNNGKLLLVDWTGPHRGMGPDSSQVVTSEAGESLAVQAGFEFDHALPGGAYHWVSLFTRRARAASASSFAV